MTVTGAGNGLPVLSLPQPHAALVARGPQWLVPVDERPPSVMRGRCAIASTDDDPVHESRFGAPALPHDRMTCAGPAFPHGDRWYLTPMGVPATGHWPLPLGAIVGSAVLVDCLPITTHADIGDPECIVVHGDGTADHCIPSWHADQTEPADPPGVVTVRLDPVLVPDGAHLIRDVSEQVRFGGLDVGRWALVLENAAPTEARCPWCWGRGWIDGTPPGVVPRGQLESPCPVPDCSGYTVAGCPPIPVPGRRGISTWRPD